MKSLKFRAYLMPKVLSGEKYSTWRLFDDKDIQEGNEVDLLEFVTNRYFGNATVTKVVEKPMGELTAEDKAGHEEFDSDEQMYEVYTTYYKQPVGPETFVKVIWFELRKQGKEKQLFPK
ncbi:MAG: ASCH domain-containing protein [Patescibacteria group bacterium]